MSAISFPGIATKLCCRFQEHRWRPRVFNIWNDRDDHMETSNRLSHPDRLEIFGKYWDDPDDMETRLKWAPQVQHAWIFSFNQSNHYFVMLSLPLTIVYSYVLIDWVGGRTRKYLARGHGVRTERSEVCAPWPRAKYFPVRPDLTQSINILSYKHRAFLLFFFFSGNKIRYRNVHSRRSFWPKSRDLHRNKVVSVRISQRAVRDPSRAGRLFPALLAPSRTALIRGFSQ